MKKLSISLVCLAVLSLAAAPAWAVPAFNDAFKAMYVKPGSPLADKVAEAKCNVCHGKNAEGKDDKKVRNDYGKAVVGAAKNVSGANVSELESSLKGLESAVKDIPSSGSVKQGLQQVQTEAERTESDVRECSGGAGIRH